MGQKTLVEPSNYVLLHSNDSISVLLYVSLGYTDDTVDLQTVANCPRNYM